MDNSPINNLVDIQLGMNTGAHLYERLHEQIISSLWHSQETYLYKHVLSSCSFSQPVHDITTFRYKISIIFVAQICSSQSSKWNYSIRWNATPPQTPILIEIPSTGSRRNSGNIWKSPPQSHGAKVSGSTTGSWSWSCWAGSNILA